MLAMPPDSPPEPAIVQHGEAKARPYRVPAGKWRIDVYRDDFAGATHCVVHRRGITIGPIAATFQLPRKSHTFDAVYRIDDGPSVSWHQAAIGLAAQGVPIEFDDLKNPSAGRVPIPLATLAAARQVVIRAAPRQRSYVFAVEGLAAAVDAAAAAGCPRATS